MVKQLKPKVSSGADFISNKLLKEIAPFIITPLHYLINLSLETSFVPRELKLAKVIPVFKDGDKHEFTNYRPNFGVKKRGKWGFNPNQKECSSKIYYLGWFNKKYIAILRLQQ